MRDLRFENLVIRARGLQDTRFAIPVAGNACRSLERIPEPAPERRSLVFRQMDFLRRLDGETEPGEAKGVERGKHVDTFVNPQRIALSIPEVERERCFSQ